MPENTSSPEFTLHFASNYLGFLTLCYSMIVIMANWFDARLIHFFHMNTDAGTLIFPLTLLLSDSITEVYGYKHARRAIWLGFLFNLLFLGYGQLVIHLPSPNFQTNNQLFDQLLSINVRIIFASITSYFISESLNSQLMAKLKIIMYGNYMGIRFVFSTFIASGLDSFIFSFIAFYGTINHSELLALIFSMWFIKVVIEIIGLPISIKLTKKLKKIEKLDIYDTKTNFNLFSLESNYSNRDNKYKL